ncbi:MAG: J domain-containing protein [Desulfobulbaceae bacterium]|nr:J domain-containing protein [Desulfobulbaceae bacterium]
MLLFGWPETEKEKRRERHGKPSKTDNILPPWQVFTGLSMTVLLTYMQCHEKPLFLKLAICSLWWSLCASIVIFLEHGPKKGAAIVWARLRSMPSSGVEILKLLWHSGFALLEFAINLVLLIISFSLTVICILAAVAIPLTTLGALMAVPIAAISALCINVGLCRLLCAIVESISPSLEDYFSGLWWNWHRREGAQRQQTHGNQEQSHGQEQSRDYEYSTGQKNASDDCRQSDEERDYAAVLGLGDLRSVTEIKRRYRQLAAQYHPDKVNHLGPKLQETAANETKKINAAYEFFRRRYNL